MWDITGCGYNWVWIQLGVDTTWCQLQLHGLGCNWVWAKFDMGYNWVWATTGYRLLLGMGNNWVWATTGRGLQLGIATTGYGLQLHGYGLQPVLRLQLGENDYHSPCLCFS